ncbi:DNA/RNA non-specific endonuclease [Rhizobium jaguaris]|nr:DNA/RNA non-specific endonuclease [Rhizobium jaguaris]
MGSNSADLRPGTLQAVRERLAASLDKRKLNREKVASGDWSGAEPNDTRALAYRLRIDRKAGHAEATYGTNDFQPAAFLPGGARARRSVAMTSMDTPGESRTGTGFLISTKLFLTNQHVIKNAEEAALTQILFDYELDDRGEIVPETVFALDPSTLFIASDEGDLDYALVAVGKRIRGTGDLAGFGFSPLSNTPDRHQLGIYANIVQHPNGQRKSVVLRNNLVLSRDDDKGRLYYETDTLEGSSGSPVHNDLWDVIALHHYGEVSADIDGPDGKQTRSVNEGIRISSIYDDLGRRVDALPDQSRALLQDALVLWKTDTPTERTLTPGPRSASDLVVSQVRAESSISDPRPQMEHDMSLPEGETKIIVPLEISIKIGQPDAAASSAHRELSKLSASTPGTALRSLAEAQTIDRNYSNRNGFDPGFVPGLDINLATVVASVGANVAPLLEPSDRPLPGELAYQNFSVVMNKTHRIAIVTATNIDGETYIAIDRATGGPSAHQPEREADTWFKDSRINEALTLTNDFYQQWGHFFDRGHLTRRNDPTWGPNASRANTDTFHFTNCSPQHWKFNESTDFWQGIERYVLEQGLWETGLNKRLTVLQGPLYDAPQPLYADEVEVPNAFWKIVVWKGKGGLKAVALVADQSELLSIPRDKGGAGKPDDKKPVQISQFRSTIAEVARRSGLDLHVLVPYDTAAGDLPHVGEANIRLTAFSQINVS